MPRLPVPAYVATTILLLLLLAASPSAASFTCAEPNTCRSAMGYIVPNATTYPELISRFNTCTLQDLLDANNNLTSSSTGATIPADTTVSIPFACLCGRDGVGRSDGHPVYTVQQGDILDNISRYAFGGFVTYQEVADANHLPDANDISPQQSLWIPLPCSCDRVDGSDVVHFAYSVGEDDNIRKIATKYGVAESTLLRLNNMSVRDGHKLTIGQILDVPLPLPAAQKVQGGRGLAPLVIAGTFLLVAVIWFSVACFKYKDQGKSLVKGAEDFAKRYEYRELSMATDKFSKSRELGQGAFGIVYEGNLMYKDGHGQQDQVAVKKIKGSIKEINDFHAELETISKTRHKNLVILKGWCSRNRSNLINFMCWCRQKQSVELFLVYELVPNGDLDLHLNKKEHVLPWATRFNIVKNIGSALHYLHHDCNECILHRDIKPSNILLDEQYNAKLGDFGLSRIAQRANEVVLTTSSEVFEGDLNANAVVMTMAAGTAGYMDPKCMKDGMVSFNRSSDIYSFGIVLLEIACTGNSRAQVWDLYKRNQENMAAVADARLNSKFDVAQMQLVVVLGLWCSFPDDARRPSMPQVVEVLEHNAALPNLMEYECRRVAGSEGNETTDKDVDGTCYPPTASRSYHKKWQRSRAILSYVKLARRSETDPVLSS